MIKIWKLETGVVYFIHDCWDIELKIGSKGQFKKPFHCNFNMIDPLEKMLDDQLK